MNETIEKKKHEESCRIINCMGGTVAVSEKFGLTTGAVSQWRFGIPAARLQTIKLLRPDLFK